MHAHMICARVFNTVSIKLNVRKMIIIELFETNYTMHGIAHRRFLDLRC